MKKTILACTVFSFALLACSNEKAPATQEAATKNEPMVATQPAENLTADKNQASTEINQSKWVGDYKGTLPCADCEGIKTEIELNNDYTYELEQEYLKTGNENKSKIKGKFKFDSKNASIIELDQSADNVRLLIGENKLTYLPLDSDKPTEGALAEFYILKKDIN